MQYMYHVSSPLGGILLAGFEDVLTGLWFEGQKYYAHTLVLPYEEKHLPVFAETERWLDQYFKGINPDFSPSLAPQGTPFQREVWDILLSIPYGQTMTYGQIASVIAEKRGLPHMSSQAVGGAVGRNPISIIIPCHRVLGSGGSLTGYAGGIDRKERLLCLEGIL